MSHEDNPLELYNLPSLYDLIVPPGPCEAFYRKLASCTGGPILELACGTGRLTIPLALDGHEVVGLDASPSMLCAACTKAEAKGLKVEFIQGDMRTFDLGRRFALVIISCNSLAHLTRNEDVVACLTQIARHVMPGGVFAFDIVNPNMRELAQPETAIPQSRCGLDQLSVAGGKELIAYDQVRQVQVIRLHLQKTGEEVRIFAPMNLRVFFPQEVPLHLALAGLELAARYGDFDGNHLTGCSPNQICIARPAGSRACQSVER